jgi:uncharacterized protein (TIGR00255 family)
MYKSMTAYGRSLVASPICDISLELISVNRKHLDIRLNMPQELARFEPYFRSLFEGQVERGAVQVKLAVKWKEELPLEIHPNTPLIKKYIATRRAVEQQFGTVSDNSALMDWVFKQEGVLLTLHDEAQDEQISALLKEAFNKALVPFSHMKKKEGLAIHEDVDQRAQFLKETVLAVEQLAPQATAKYREKLTKILSEFAPTQEDRERLFKEAALYADRVDITEEVIRFHSHLKQLLDAREGKTLDFILQEMMREVNTMGNKAQDATISPLVVAMKAELEKIREQIQNVE